jgi:hypothetical protein
MGLKRLRSNYKDSQSISPPSKMVKGRKSAGDEEGTISDVLAAIGELKGRFDKLEKDTKEILGVMKEVESLKAKLKEIEVVIDEFKRFEIENKKRSLLVKGIKFTTNNKFESRQDTQTSLKCFFEKIGYLPRLFDWYRMGGKRDQTDDGSKIPIRIVFDDMDRKYTLFEKMKEKGRDPEIRNINIVNDYPKFQVEAAKRLNAEAYEIRKANPGTRTRVVPKGLGLSLQTRTDASERWTNVRE